MKIKALVLLCSVFAASACAGVPEPAAAPEAAPAIAEAVDSPLSFLFGEWVGTAKGIGADRQPYVVVQTERVGPMLDGEVTVIEGRGYDADGSVQFNALAVVSRNSQTGEWEMRSYSGGNSGTFPFAPTGSGFQWSVQAGPGARMVYTATIADGKWDQIGEFVPEGGEPIQVFEMNLVRTGDTGWPAAGFVRPPAN